MLPPRWYDKLTKYRHDWRLEAYLDWLVKRYTSGGMPIEDYLELYSAGLEVFKVSEAELLEMVDAEWKRLHEIEFGAMEREKQN